MTIARVSQSTVEVLLPNSPLGISVDPTTLTITSIGTTNNVRVSQVAVEVLSSLFTQGRASQVAVEVVSSGIPAARLSQASLEVIRANNPNRLTIDPVTVSVTTNDVAFIVPMPSGLLPSVSGYKFKLPTTATRTEIQGGANRYGIKYTGGEQLHTLSLSCSVTKLEEFMAWYHHDIAKGTATFSLTMNSGTGLSTHNVLMIPGTLRVQHNGNNAEISFDLAVQSKILDMTQEQADAFLVAWESNTSRTNYTGSFIYTSRFPYSLPNSSMSRFDARYWTIDFRIGSIATIVGDTATAFTVNAEFRSNIDLVGIFWNSLDKYGHALLRYDTYRDYTGSYLAFVANALDPWNFSITFTAGNGQQYIYRLFPFYNNSGTLSPYITDLTTQGAGTGHTYSTATLFPSGLTVPTGYHVYILDFSTLKLGFSYDGASIPVTDIASMFMSMVPAEYGIGANAVLANATAEDLTSWHITGVPADFRLAAGNVLTVTYSIGAVFHTEDVTVTTWSGDGTTSRYITMATPRPGTTWTGGKVLAKVLSLDSPLGSVSLSFTVQNISVTGTDATIGKYEYPQPANGLKMATGLDDTYSINPWRQVEQIYKLGYRNEVICYMGASHFYKASSFLNTGVYFNRIVTTDSDPLNHPTVVWCQYLFSNLVSRGLGFVWSTSLEIFLDHIPPDWAQKDVDDNLAASGYTPPTSFLNFVMPEVLTYLTNVIKQGLGLLTTAGIPLNVQLGEWWSWDGSYSNFKPAIYAYNTKLAYNTETGLFAPTTITNIFQQPLTSDETAYCNWLQLKLGDATATVRDSIKTAYPSTRVCLLFFSPQIFNQASVILSIINFPEAAWSYPNYDFMQIEDYDWIIARSYNLLVETRNAANIRLKYPLNLIDYFVGFVNVQSDQYIWNGMHRATTEAVEAGVTNIVLWAYPQVIRDNIVDGIRLPRGIVPTINSGPQEIMNTDGVFRTDIDGATKINALLWKRGNRQINVGFEVTSEELEALLVFLYFKVALGTITFSLPTDDGSGFKLQRVNIIPGSVEVTALGYEFWHVTMTVEGEPGYYA